ncbi:MAG: DUF2726 domain-containing protein [Oscillospiraceae bacterium]|nr:DUF2726 domain-containing protein [Oscillospiraceae bacterium]
MDILEMFKDAFITLLGNSWFVGSMIFIIVASVLNSLLDRRKRKKTAIDGDYSSISITDVLPYRVKDNFLTPTEYVFFHALLQTVNNRAYICPKVGIKDFLFISKGTSSYMKYWGSISQKHIDFLLCHPQTMQPLCAIELDDPSHNDPKVQKRDAFVEKVYKDANLPLVRFKTKESYDSNEIEYALKSHLTGTYIPKSTPIVMCSKCGIPMIIKTTKHGNKKFYGCKNFPNCRESYDINLMPEGTS